MERKFKPGDVVVFSSPPGRYTASGFEGCVFKVAAVHVRDGHRYIDLDDGGLGWYEERFKLRAESVIDKVLEKYGKSNT